MLLAGVFGGAITIFPPFVSGMLAFCGAFPSKKNNLSGQMFPGGVYRVENQ
jgi:hypothetical protein